MYLRLHIYSGNLHTQTTRLHNEPLFLLIVSYSNCPSVLPRLQNSHNFFFRVFLESYLSKAAQVAALREKTNPAFSSRKPFLSRKILSSSVWLHNKSSKNRVPPRYFFRTTMLEFIPGKDGPRPARSKSGITNSGFPFLMALKNTA